MRERRFWDTLLESAGRFLPFVPERFRPAVAAFLAAAGLLVGAIYATAPEPGYPATALLAVEEGVTRDINLVVAGGAGRIIETPPDAHGHMPLVAVSQSLPDRLRHRVEVAPVMGWQIPYVLDTMRGGAPLRVCFAGLDAPSVTTAHQALDEIWSFYALPAYEVTGCSTANIHITDRAEADCGMTYAVGCAAYKGAQTHISFSGALYRAGQLSQRGILWTLRHELGHLFDLGHTDCAHDHPSAMSGVFLPDGPTCAARGANRLIWEDYEEAERLYGLTRRAAPTPQPSPSPQPRTGLTREQVLALVAARYWHYAGEADSATDWDTAIRASLMAEGISDVYWSLDRDWSP